VTTWTSGKHVKDVGLITGGLKNLLLKMETGKEKNRLNKMNTRFKIFPCGSWDLWVVAICAGTA
jgi:hypothetical protein